MQTGPWSGNAAMQHLDCVRVYSDGAPAPGGDDGVDDPGEREVVQLGAVHGEGGQDDLLARDGQDIWQAVNINIII